MTKTFVILYKDSLKIETYTTLSAVYEAHDKIELGVSKYTLDRIDWVIDSYENNELIIMQSITRTAGEIKRSKEVLL